MKKVGIFVLSAASVCALLAPGIAKAKSGESGQLILERGQPNSGYSLQSDADAKAANEKAQRAAEYMRQLNKSGVGADLFFPDSRTLNSSSYIQQPDSDTCGPTSLRNAATNSGQYPTVVEVAQRIDYVPGDGTYFNNRLPTAMNHYDGGNYYVLKWSPTQTEVWDAAVTNTLNDHPLAYNVHMVRGGDHLEGYPSDRTYWHYVTGNGYRSARSSSRKVGYFDPFNQDTGAGNPFGQQYITPYRMANFVHDRGMVW